MKRFDEYSLESAMAPASSRVFASGSHLAGRSDETRAGGGGFVCRGLIGFLILLISGVFLFPANAAVYYVNDTSTVGDSYTTSTGADTQPGTIAAPFRNINKAVDSAVSGDTIYVDAGIFDSYVEIVASLETAGVNIKVDSIAIIGVDSALTVIDPPGDSSAAGLYGVFADTQANLLIKNIGVTGAYYGIFFDNVDLSRIENDSVSQCGQAGVYLRAGSDSNTITTGIMRTNVSYGIHLLSSVNNTLSNNTCTSQSLEAIYVQSSSANTLSGNFVGGSTGNHGIYLDGSSGNILTGNTVQSNGQNGIYLVSSSNNNTLSNNMSKLNTQYAFYLATGSSNNTLTSCTALSNTSYGMVITASSNNTVSNCDFINNGGEGIDVSGSNHTLSGNTITAATPMSYALFVAGGGHRIVNNHLSGASEGIRLQGCTTTLIFQNEIRATNYQIRIASTTSSDTIEKNNMDITGGTVVENASTDPAAKLIFTRNWWGTTDTVMIQSRISQASNGDSVIWQPYRHGAVDTAAGADTVAPKSPDSVTIAVATGGDTSIVLTWSGVTASEEGVEASGVALSGYRVYRSKVKDTSLWLKIVDLGNVQTFQDTNVVSNTTYYYRVTAFDTKSPFGNESYFSDSQPSDSAVVYSGPNWYVNDTWVNGTTDSFTYAGGSDTSGDGSASKPYRSIPLAMTKVSSGETIWIDAGFYDSYVTVNGTETAGVNINKDSIALIGKDSGATVIDPPGANTISGLYGIYADTQVNLLIKNIGVTGAREGIYFAYVRLSTITSDSIGACREGIFLINGSDTNMISNNFSQSNSFYGIELTASVNNTISGNSTNSQSRGIYLVTSSNNNTISGNTSNSNSQYGIALTTSSSGNTVSGNTANSNGFDGIFLSSGSGNTVSGNTANSNTNDGIDVTSSASGNTIIGNTANSNTLNGIELNSTYTNTVVGNTIKSNVQAGVYMHNAETNTITQNDVSNHDTGLWIHGTSNTNTIVKNNLTNSVSVTLFNQSPNVQTLARNWFGSADSVTVKSRIIDTYQVVAYSPYRLAAVDTTANADTVAPKAPDTVAVVGSPSDTSVIVAWEAVTANEDADAGAAGVYAYRVYRSAVKDTSSWSLLVQVGSGVVRYQDTDALPGVRYYYRVTTLDTGGAYGNESFFSDSQPTDSAVFTSTKNWYVNDVWVNGTTDSLTYAGGSDTAYGVGTALRPFRTIPRAMQFATAGDTIWIDAGLYDSFVTVNGAETAGVNIDKDSITLIGRDSALTVIDPPGANTISGLYGIYADTQVNLAIKNLAVTGAYEGIYFTDVDRSTISGDSVGGNGDAGIYLYNGSDTNTVAGNTANSNTNYGVEIALNANSNTLSNNTTASNGQIGIYLITTAGNAVTGNTANSNLLTGIWLISSTGNTLTGNTVNSNTQYGIQLQSSPGNAVVNNAVRLNVLSGIKVNGSDTSRIVQNDISGGDTGIWFVGTAQGNVITRNNIISNAVNNIHNQGGLSQSLIRNWFGSVDSVAIKAKINDTASAFSPYRIGVVDTASGADTVAPKAPDTAVIIASPSDTSILVDWAAVTAFEEVAGSGNVTGYRVYRSAVKDTSSWIKVAQTGASTYRYQDTTVVIGQKYYYRVTAFDSATFENESFFSDSQPSDSAMFTSRKNWYVNDTSTAGDSWATAIGSDLAGNGSISAPFLTIGRAMRFVKAGDSVFADAGTYAETVVIENDTVSLFGKDSASTIIDPPGTTNTGIFADTQVALLIKNLAVTGASDGIDFQGVIRSVITGVSADTNTSRGIRLANGSDTNTVSNNAARGNTSLGIHLSASQFNTVTGNYSASNNHGFQFDSFSDNNTITTNTARSNANTGFIFSASSSNAVRTNAATLNIVAGFDFSSSSNSNKIFSNAARSNTGAGIVLNGSSSSAVSQNDITNNDTGVRLTGSFSGNIIFKNNISNNVVNNVSNVPATAQTFSRNWWGTTQETLISAKFGDTASAFKPYRLGRVDTTPGADTRAPYIYDTSIIVTAGSETALIRWDTPVQDEDSEPLSSFTLVGIFRLAVPDSTHWDSALIRDISPFINSFVDTGLVNGTKYYYRLTALDGASPFENESFFTDTKSVVPVWMDTGRSTVYVSSAGDSSKPDASDTSKSFRNINEALAALNPNNGWDTIVVFAKAAGDSYQVDMLDFSVDTGITLISKKAFSGSDPVFDTWAKLSRDTGTIIKAVSDARIEGLFLDGIDSTRTGVGADPPAVNVNEHNAIFLPNASSGVIIRGIDIRRVHFGIVADSATHSFVLNSRIADLVRDGIHFDNGSQDNLIAGNTIERQWHSGGHGHGIKLKTNTAQNIIRDNIVRNVNMAMEFVSTGGKNHIYHNQIYNSDTAVWLSVAGADSFVKNSIGPMNTGAALIDMSSSANFDMRRNWWGVRDMAVILSKIATDPSAKVFPHLTTPLDTSSVTADTIAPSKPETVTITGASPTGGRVTVTWDTPDHNDDGGSNGPGTVGFYNIYRLTAPAVDTTDWKNAFLAQVPAGVLVHFDQSVTDGITYYYRISAGETLAGGFFNESVFTDTLSAVPSIDTVGPNVWYVNDTSTAGDSFTTAVGSDANSGTSRNSPFRNIARVVPLLSSGDTLYIDKGLFDSVVSVVGGSETAVLRIDTDYVTVIGKDSASTVLDPAGAHTTAGLYGVYADTQIGLTIKNIGVTGAFTGIYFVNVDLSTITGDSVSALGNYGMVLMNGSDTNTVSGNAADSNAIGIEVIGGLGNTVNNNSARMNSVRGIGATSCVNTSIDTNAVMSNATGIDISGGSANTVMGNTVDSNTSNGIYLRSMSTGGTVSGNSLTANGNMAILLSNSSSNNTISNNVCQSNGGGIMLDFASNNNTISGNTVKSSTSLTNGSGIAMVGGSSNNTVAGNVVMSNAVDGIEMGDTATGNTIRNNLVRANVWAGIILGNGADTNIIRLNDISASDTGIWIMSTARSNTIVKNNITGNNINNVFSVAARDTGIAQTLSRNWFGSVDSSVIKLKFADTASAFSPYRLAAVDTVIGADTTAPKAPDTVAIIGSPSDTSVIVAWEAVTANEDADAGSAGVFAYRVYRSAVKDTSSWALLVQVGSGVVRYQDTGVALGARYYYRVTTLDTGGAYGNESFYSDSQPSDSAVFTSTTKWYVNDASTSGDLFTTAAGNDVTGLGKASSPFRTVQRAMQFVTTGDTIFIDRGTFDSFSQVSATETAGIKIDIDALYIIGVDSNATVIDPPGDSNVFGLYGIFADTQTGLTIKNIGITGARRAIYFQNVDNSTITGDSISFCMHGIFMDAGSDTNTISINRFSYPQTNAIDISSGSGNTFSGNTIQNSAVDGVYVSASTGNTFSNNTVQSSSQSGFNILSSSNNTFSGNTSTSNGLNGITLSGSSSNTLSSNAANSNTGDGIKLTSGSDTNTLTGNTTSSNTGKGVLMNSSSFDNRVSGAVMTSNAGGGIEFDVSSNRNIVRNSVFRLNTGFGVKIGSADSNVIVANDITGSDTGVYITGSSAGNIIVKNNLTALTFSIVQNAAGLAQTTARNWLGSNDEVAAGPKLTDTANSYKPFRLGEVDTAAGADTTAPALPTGVAVDTSNGATFVFSWVIPTINEETNGGSLGFGGLKIYRLVNQSDTQHWANPANLIKTTGATDTTWIDTNVTLGKTYYYKITSFDTHSKVNQSYFGDTITVPFAVPGWTGPIWYVDKDTGADTFTGHPSYPFKTITKALQSIPADTQEFDTIMIDRNTYTETIVIDTDYIWIEGVDSGASGTVLDRGDSSGGTNSQGIRASGRHSIVIRNLRVQNSYNGINWNAVTQSRIEQVTTRLNAGCGIYTQASSESNVIMRNLSSNNAYGIYLYNASNSCTILGNTLRQNTFQGIRLEAASVNNFIETNTLDSNVGSGIYLFSGVNTNYVSGNTVTAGDTGIHLSGASSNRVLGNTVINAQTYGIHVDNSSTSNTFAGNTAKNNGWSGMNLTATSNLNLIVDNVAMSNGNNGVILWNAHRNTFMRNLASGHASGAGFSLVDADTNTFIQNEARGNLHAIKIAGNGLDPSEGNSFVRNNAMKSDSFAIVLGDGQRLSPFMWRNFLDTTNQGNLTDVFATKSLFGLIFDGLDSSSLGIVADTQPRFAVVDTTASGDSVAPNFPAPFTIADTLAGTLKVRWTTPAISEAGDAAAGISGFRIYRTTNGAEKDWKGNAFRATATAADTEFIDLSVSNGQTYYYRVTAFDGAAFPNESYLTDSIAGVPGGSFGDIGSMTVYVSDSGNSSSPTTADSPFAAFPSIDSALVQLNPANGYDTIIVYKSWRDSYSVVSSGLSLDTGITIISKKALTGTDNGGSGDTLPTLTWGGGVGVMFTVDSGVRFEGFAITGRDTPANPRLVVVNASGSSLPAIFRNVTFSHAGAGIFAGTNAAYTTIESCTFNMLDTAVRIDGNSAVIRTSFFNKISDTAIVQLVAPAEGAVIHDNIIQYAGSAMRLAAGSVSANRVLRNNIRNIAHVALSLHGTGNNVFGNDIYNTDTAILITAANTCNVKFNNIYNATTTLVRNTGASNTIRYNYFNTTDSAAIASKMIGPGASDLENLIFRFASVDTRASGDSVAPGTPLSVVPDTQIPGQIVLRWQPPSSNEDGSTPASFASYRAYRLKNMQDTTNWKLLSTLPDTSSTDTMLIDTDIVGGGKYYYRVSAVDANGNEGFMSDVVAGVPLFGGLGGVRLVTPAGLTASTYRVTVEGESVFIEVTDSDRNTNPATIESCTVTLVNITLGTDSEVFTLSELGVNNAIFMGTVPISISLSAHSAANSGRLFVRTGDQIKAFYQDTNPNGSVALLSSPAADIYGPGLSGKAVRFLTGDQQVASAGGSVGFTLAVYDTATGDTVSAATVTFTVDYNGSGSSGGGIVSASSTTGSSGLLSGSVILGSGNGVYVVRASAGGGDSPLVVYTDKRDVPASKWTMFAPFKTPDTAQTGVAQLSYSGTIISYEYDPVTSSGGSFGNYKSVTGQASPNNASQTFSQYKLGRGYWVKLASAQGLGLASSFSQQTDTFRLRLKAGSNMIGNPFVHYIDWLDDVTVETDAVSGMAMTPLTLRSLTSTAIIDTKLQWRDQAAEQYVNPVGSNDTSLQLKPWVGVWVKVNTECTMTFYPRARMPQSTRARAMAPVYASTPDASSWRMRLMAYSEVSEIRDEYGFLGSAPGAVEGEDMNDMWKAPGMLGDMQILVGEPSSGGVAPEAASSKYYGASVGPPVKTALAWPVRVTQPSGAKSATLKWDMSGVPDAYAAYLIGAPGGPVDMKRAASAALVFASPAQMTVVVGMPEFLGAYLASSLSKEATFAYPNPGPDAAGNITFTYNLQAAGEVSLKIFDVGGRTVRETKTVGAIGPNLYVWDGTNTHGQRMGSGVYIYILESNGTKLVDKLAIVR